MTTVPLWHDSLPSKGILCWVGFDIKVILAIVTSYTDGMYISSLGNFPNATPLTKEEIQDLYDEVLSLLAPSNDKV